jgi:intracellular septation protein A
MNSSFLKAVERKSMHTQWKTRVLDAVRYVFLNFATPIVFYLVFHARGAKMAISFALIATGMQALMHWIYRQKFSAFFLLSSGLIVGFGLVDLLVRDPQYFRFEPFVQNFVVGSLFLLSQWRGFAIIRFFARALPKKIQPEFLEPDDAYLYKLTWVWIVYLYSKCLFFLYLALKVDLGTLFLLKSVLGSGTLFLLIAGEWLYRKRFRARRKK